MRNTHACIFFVQFSSIWATKNLIHTFVSPLVFVCKTRRTIRNLIVVRCHVYWFSYRRPCNFLVFESFPNMAFLFLSFFFLAGGAAKSVRRLVFSTFYFTIMSGRSAWISLSAWPLKLKRMFLSSYGASHRLYSHFFSCTTQVHGHILSKCLIANTLLEPVRCSTHTPRNGLLLCFRKFYW